MRTTDDNKGGARLEAELVDPRAGAALRESEQRLRDQQRLVAGLRHRVRNTLAMVRSLVRRTAQNSRTVEEMAAHLQGRIDAFARVQAKMMMTDGSVNLMSLVEDELLAHATREGKHLVLEGEEVSLGGKPAEMLGLAIHELSANAVKFGALVADGGQIRVSWKVEERRLRLIWEEGGLSEPLARPDREGFGLELLGRVLPYEIDADTTVEFRPEGLRFVLSMPVGENVRR